MLYAVLPFLITVFMIFLGTYAYSKNKHGKINIKASILSYTIAAREFCDFMLQQSGSLPSAIFWAKADFFWPFIAPIFFHLLIVIIKKDNILHRYPIYYFLLYFPASIFSVMYIFSDIKVSMKYWGYDKNYNPLPIWLWIAVIWFFTLYILGLILCFIHYLKSPHGNEKKESKFFLIAFIIPFFASLITEIILPATNIIFFPIRPILLLWAGTIITYAILRYSFFVVDPISYSKEITNNISEALILCDLNFIIKFLNPAAENLFKYTKNELLNKHINILFQKQKDSLPFFDKKQLNNFPTGEIKIETKEHKTIYVLVSLSEIYEKKNTTFGYLVFIKDITELKNIEENLKKTLLEKDLLIKEVHHRVKNNFQLVKNLLSLKKIEINETRLNTIITDLENKINSMALLHEELYKNDGITAIDLTTYLKKISSDILINYSGNSKSMNIIYDMESVFVSVDDAIACGLILNEIITNSFKYAFPPSHSEKCEIYLNLYKKSNTEREVIIRDTGVGFPKNFQPEKLNSLGIKLIFMLVEQMNGKIEINGNNGVTYKITF